MYSEIKLNIGDTVKISVHLIETDSLRCNNIPQYLEGEITEISKRSDGWYIKCKVYANWIGIKQPHKILTFPLSDVFGKGAVHLKRCHHKAIRVDNLMYEGCEPHWKCTICGECVPFHCYRKEEFESLCCGCHSIDCNNCGKEENDGTFVVDHTNTRKVR